jgi:hypothetical protein
MNFETFIFKGYRFNKVTHILELNYSLDDKLDFSETYRFDFDFVKYDQATLDRALQSLFLMAGVSYYKAFLPNQMNLGKITLDQKDAAFFAKTYSKGLGEFFFVNGIAPCKEIPFSANTKVAVVASGESKNNGLLIGIGGGKDSLLSVEALRNADLPVATWSLGHRELLSGLVEKIGLQHFFVERNWDKKLLELNKHGALNGHVPISAIIGCAGIVTAILSGYRDVVVSNEQAANEPTLKYHGVDINHQYSKSQEFEKDFQRHLKKNLGDSVLYYSFLRPLSELYIAELFSKKAWRKYKFSFTSCNRAFRHGNHTISWCGECPKCAFVYMVLAPFISEEELDEIFHKNLLLDISMDETYRNILGISGNKPLECVGEIRDSRAAMSMCQNLYPQLKARFSFDLDDNYDYKKLNGNNMPPAIYQYLVQLIREA